MTAWISTKPVAQMRSPLTCICVGDPIDTSGVVILGHLGVGQHLCSVAFLSEAHGVKAFCLSVRGLFAFTAWNMCCHR